ncbi:hypothetical protein AN217_24510, partial [Streptomyces qinglanensis]
LGAARRDGGDALPVVQHQEPPPEPGAAPQNGTEAASTPQAATGPEAASTPEAATGPEAAASRTAGDGDWVGELLATAAARVLDERFTPSPGQQCTHCAFRAACSARPEGRQVVE